MVREGLFKAIHYIKSYRSVDKKLHDTAPKDSLSFYATQRCLNYWDMAIEALEKQMPQTPTIENGFVKYPKCKKYIRFPIVDKYNNCLECGQAIKWEESEGDEEET